MPICRIIFIVAVIAFMPSLSVAQSDQFETAIKVNGAGISKYEIDQRIRLLRSFGLAGDRRSQAEEALIEERLYIQAAEMNGIELADGELDGGMAEFALRANMTTQDFLAEIANYGVTQYSYEEFIRAGLLWRKLVNIRFDPLVAGLASENPDRTLAVQVKRTSLEVLLSEIVIPFPPEQREEALAYARRIKAAVQSGQDFADIAGSVSASPTREDGGNLNWLPIAGLPNQVQQAVSSAPNGSVVDPLVIQGVIYLFFKRATRETEAGPEAFEIEFATLAISGAGDGTADRIAGEVMSRVSTCGELEAESENWPEGSFKRHAVPSEAESNEYAAALALLDSDEASFAAEPNSGAGEIVMLCERKFLRNEEQRESAIFGLQASKIEDHARNYIQELLAAAHIQRL